MRRILPVLLAGTLAACATFPEIDAMGAETGPPPQLLPLDDLLAQAGQPSPDPAPDLGPDVPVITSLAELTLD